MSSSYDADQSGLEAFLDTPKRAAAIADGATAGIPLAEAELAINPDVIAAAERWRDIDAHSLSQLEGALTSKAGVFADAHLLDALTGYSGEVIAARADGAVLPDVTNVPVIDFVVNGVDHQVKVGESAGAAGLEAARRHPSLVIDTNPDAAHTIVEHGYNAIGHAALSTPHLDAAISGTVHGVGTLTNVLPTIPLFSAMICTLREAKGLSSGTVSLEEAAANVGTAVGLRSAGIWIMGLVAAYVFDLHTGGLLPVGLTITGSLAGGSAGDHAIKSGAVRSALDAVLSPFRQLTPVTDEERARWRKGNHKNPAMAADIDAALGRAQARGELMTTWQRGKLIADVMKPHLAEKTRREIDAYDIKVVARSNAYLLKLTLELVQLEQRTQKPPKGKAKSFQAVKVEPIDFAPVLECLERPCYQGDEFYLRMKDELRKYRPDPLPIEVRKAMEQAIRRADQGASLQLYADDRHP